jgi:hypothetical protein
MIYVIFIDCVGRRGRAREGVTPHRAQNKPFHGLRIVFWAPENAPPAVGVIATGGTTRRPGVFREFLNGK